MSLAVTPRHDLPLLAAGQAQKHVTVNEALIDLDARLQLHLEALDMVEPPAAPAIGQMFGLASAPTGPWSGHGGKLALFLPEGWRLMTPGVGWRASVGAACVVHVHDGAAWVPAAAREFSVTGRLGVGAAADAANPVVMRGNGMLLDASTQPGPDSGDVRLRMNRAAASDVCSLLFQTGYSGRAEIGLSAANALEVRVSPDGSSFATALAVSPQTGIVRFPAQPAFRARRTGSDQVIAAAGAVLAWNDAPLNIGQGFEVAASRFVAPADGSYLLMASVLADLAGQRTSVQLVRNATVVLARAERADVGGATETLSLHTIEWLNAGDAVDVRLVAGTVRLVTDPRASFSGAFLG
jgi:hypothetical protein